MGFIHMYMGIYGGGVAIVPPVVILRRYIRLKTSDTKGVLLRVK